MEGKSFREGRSGPQSLVPQKGKIEFGKCPLDFQCAKYCVACKNYRNN